MLSAALMEQYGTDQHLLRHSCDVARRSDYYLPPCPDGGEGRRGLRVLEV
jgi:hypothetical protein